MDRAVHEMSSRELLRELADGGVIDAPRAPALTRFTPEPTRAPASTCVEVRCTQCGFVGVATAHEARAGELRHDAASFGCWPPGEARPCGGAMVPLEAREHREAPRG